MKHFAKLHDEKRELAMLEWAYLIIAVGAVIIAGILALFDQALGWAVMVVPMLAAIALCTNVVAWALIKLAADTFLTKKSDKNGKK